MKFRFRAFLFASIVAFAPTSAQGAKIPLDHARIIMDTDSSTFVRYAAGLRSARCQS